MVAPVQKDSLTDYQVALATYLRITSPVAGMFTGSEIKPNPNARSIRVPDIRVDDYIVDADFTYLDRPLADSRLIDASPARGTFGMPEARVIAPGDPWRSVLWYRICTEGSGRMPVQGSRRVDEAGTALVARWIEGLAPVRPPSESVRAARARVASTLG